MTLYVRRDPAAMKKRLDRGILDTHASTFAITGDVSREKDRAEVVEKLWRWVEIALGKDRG